jgi:hypothetical protein
MYTAEILFLAFAFAYLVGVAITHSYTITWAKGSETFSKQFNVTGDQEKGGDYTIANGVTNQLITLTIDVSALKSILIVSTVAMTLKTNDSGAPQDTIALTAGVPIMEYVGDISGAMFAGDVTAFYVSNASGSEGTLTIKILEDGTP